MLNIHKTSNALQTCLKLHREYQLDYQADSRQKYTFYWLDRARDYVNLTQNRLTDWEALAVPIKLST